MSSWYVVLAGFDLMILLLWLPKRWLSRCVPSPPVHTGFQRWKFYTSPNKMNTLLTRCQIAKIN